MKAEKIENLEISAAELEDICVVGINYHVIFPSKVYIKDNI